VMVCLGRVQFEATLPIYGVKQTSPSTARISQRGLTALAHPTTVCAYSDRRYYMREVLLLRWSQIGIVLCGLALIAIGIGLPVPSLAMLLGIALSAIGAGLVYELMLNRRGEGDGAMAMLLPLAGGLSGVYALMTAV